MMTSAVTPPNSTQGKAVTPSRDAAPTQQPGARSAILFTHPEAPQLQEGYVRPLRCGRRGGQTNPETLSSATAAAAEGFRRITEEPAAAAGAEHRLRSTVVLVPPTSRWTDGLCDTLRHEMRFYSEHDHPAWLSRHHQLWFEAGRGTGPRPRSISPKGAVGANYINRKEPGEEHWEILVRDELTPEDLAVVEQLPNNPRYFYRNLKPVMWECIHPSLDYRTRDQKHSTNRLSKDKRAANRAEEAARQAAAPPGTERHRGRSPLRTDGRDFTRNVQPRLTYSPAPSEDAKRRHAARDRREDTKRGPSPGRTYPHRGRRSRSRSIDRGWRRHERSRSHSRSPRRTQPPSAPQRPQSPPHRASQPNPGGPGVQTVPVDEFVRAARQVEQLTEEKSRLITDFNALVDGWHEQHNERTRLQAELDQLKQQQPQTALVPPAAPQPRRMETADEEEWYPKDEYMRAISDYNKTTEEYHKLAADYDKMAADYEAKHNKRQEELGQEQAKTRSVQEERDTVLTDRRADKEAAMYAMNAAATANNLRTEVQAQRDELQRQLHAK